MTKTGILHFGPGAFHRAHQADYVQRLLEQDHRWGISAVSLRSHGTIGALKAQRGRYTLAILDDKPALRTIRVHSAFFGPGEGAGVRRTLQDPGVRVVSCTVTERGYCLAGDGTLDFAHPDIVRDLAAPEHPASIVGWLALGLRDRRDAGVTPFTRLCCDNMTSNGKTLGRAVAEFARRFDTALADWIEAEVRFPDTMVDSVTPASDKSLRALVRGAAGFDDAIPVSREPYAAWIIEDVLPEGTPDLAAVGAVLAADVGAWEKAKLRLLNGAHSSLSYLGLVIGHETVADAMADRQLAGFVERLMREDVAASLVPSPINLEAYSGEILARFRNRAIRHRLSQIAWDGSQKLPYRLLHPFRSALAAGRPVDRLAVPIAAWMLFVDRQAQAGEELVDPLADILAAISRSGRDLVPALLGLPQIFPQALADDQRFRSAVTSAADVLRNEGPRACLSAYGGAAT